MSVDEEPTHASVDLDLLDELVTQLGDARTAGEATRRLVELGPGAAAPLGMALRKSGYHVRVRLVEALGQIGGPLARAALEQALRRDRSMRVRMACVRLLASSGDRGAVDALIAALRDGHPKVRTACATALGNMRSADAVPGLLGAIHDASPAVRVACVNALSTLRDRSAVPALISAFGDSDRNVARAAMAAAGVIGDLRAVLPLAQAAAGVYDFDRSAAAKTLHAFGDNHSLPRNVVAAAELTAQEKVETLQALGRVRVWTGFHRVHYRVPDPLSLSEALSLDPSQPVRAGAVALREYLTLVRGGQLPAAGAETLLRPTESTPTGQPGELLRASEDHAQEVGESPRATVPTHASSLGRALSWLRGRLGLDGSDAP